MLILTKYANILTESLEKSKMTKIIRIKPGEILYPKNTLHERTKP